MTTTKAASGPLGADELRLIDAYWRAANYLSVGQIYLLDNPLLREPLTLEHVKPRLLGHWGTTPGLNFLYAHMNRAIRAARPERDLRHRPRPRRPGPVANTYLEGTYTEVYPARRARTRRAAPAVPAVLLPRRHPEPRRARDAGLDPRGRRARLRARARVRRGVRQPRPARALRGRRRRGRDRAARGELALEQVPQPGARRRGPAGPAPQRLQDRQPDGARAHPATTSCARCSRATATRRSSSRATTRGGAPGAGRCARRGRSTRSPASRRGAATAATWRRPALADDRAAHAEGLDRPEGGRRPAGRGHVPLPPGAARQPGREPGAPRQLEDWLRSYRPEELFDDDGPAAAGARARLRPRGRAPDGRQPARQRRAAAARPRAARLPRLRRRRRRARPTRSSEATRCSAPGCATSCARNPHATSASSGPTRRPRTGSAPSSRRPTAPGWPSAPTATTTSRPTAA